MLLDLLLLVFKHACGPKAQGSYFVKPYELLSKLLVSPFITPIVVPYIIPHITPLEGV